MHTGATSPLFLKLGVTQSQFRYADSVVTYCLETATGCVLLGSEKVPSKGTAQLLKICQHLFK
jgi:hypothetical protein